MRHIWVRLKGRRYPILVGPGAVRRLPRLLRELRLRNAELCLVTTSIVRRLHGERLAAMLRRHGWRCWFVVVPDAESSKSARVYLRLVERLVRRRARGEPVLIALGGGVVGDLVGFTAATLKRGVPYLQIPTTLLAQVDSAIGGKTALDLPAGKNLIGTFYQPLAVISDTAYLHTLPQRELRSGLAEVIKYGLLGDPMLFWYLERRAAALLAAAPSVLAWVVHRCEQAKVRLVERDEYDRRHIRMRLNLGHTFGHAIETATAYTRRFSHGQAVAVGMVGATRLARRLGRCSPVVEERLVVLLRRIGLPTSCPGVPSDRILSAMRHDKKFTARGNRFVLPTRIGQVRIEYDVPDTLIRQVVHELTETQTTSLGS